MLTILFITLTVFNIIICTKSIKKEYTELINEINSVIDTSNEKIDYLIARDANINLKDYSESYETYANDLLQEKHFLEDSYNKLENTLVELINTCNEISSKEIIDGDSVNLEILRNSEALKKGVDCYDNVINKFMIIEINFYDFQNYTKNVKLREIFRGWEAKYCYNKTFTNHFLNDDIKVLVHAINKNFIASKDLEVLNLVDPLKFDMFLKEEMLNLGNDIFLLSI